MSTASRVASVVVTPASSRTVGWGLNRAKQEVPMSSKSDFTDEEWSRLKRAPFVAGMAISLADPGGPIEAFKETKATLHTVTGAIGGDRGPLVQTIAGEVAAEARPHHSP